MKPDASLSPARWLHARQRPHRRWLVLTAASTLMATLATIALAGLVAGAIHAALFSPVGPDRAWLLLNGAGLISLRYFAQALRDLAGHRLAFAIKDRLRGDLLQGARRAGPVRLASHATVG
ncbi:MAG: thiol reductant ABC exporter subunit CydD, partial [Thioalkalivibrio sp.]|nr:thiol reductant ABC exporter subunit CydD [Thioalkalivibrio sp.]